MKKPKGNRIGFSLVEVIIALGIVASAFVVLFALLPIGVNLVKESANEGVAVNILTTLASDIKSSDDFRQTPIHQITLDSEGSGTLYFDENGRWIETPNSAPAVYKVSWAIVAADSSNGTIPHARLHASWPAAATNPTEFFETLVPLSRNPSSP